MDVQPVSTAFPCQTVFMLRLLRPPFVLFGRSFYSRCDLLLENLVLRQQLAVLKKKHPGVRLSDSDRLFWIALLRLWSKWKRALVLVQPETVVPLARRRIQALLEMDIAASRLHG